MPRLAFGEIPHNLKKPLKSVFPYNRYNRYVITELMCDTMHGITQDHQFPTGCRMSVLVSRVVSRARRSAGFWPAGFGLFFALVAVRGADGCAFRQKQELSSWAVAHAASIVHASRNATGHESALLMWSDRWIDQHRGQSLTMQSSSGECQCLAIHLAGSHHVWPLHIKIPAGIHLVAVNGLLPDIPLVEYLRWRRSLNPARFDHWHPRVGPMLAEDQRVRESLCSQVATQIVGPPPTVPTPVTIPHVTHAPEPSTASMSLVLLASAAAACRWTRRQGA